MNRFESSLPTSPFPISDTGTGYLIVRVSTARSAIPLEGAVVHVRSRVNEENETTLPSPGSTEEANPEATLIATLRSDPSGLTPRLALPAPPKIASESPGNGRPYAVYDIDVSLAEYQNQYYAQVPIFDTITSLQSVELVPLTEQSQGAIDFDPPSRFYESGKNALL